MPTDANSDAGRRAQELRTRNAELTAGETVTEQDVQRARDHAQSSRSRAARAHDQAAVGHEQAASTHRDAALIHDRAADDGVGNLVAHRAAADRHRSAADDDESEARRAHSEAVAEGADGQ